MRHREGRGRRRRRWIFGLTAVAAAAVLSGLVLVRRSPQNSAPPNSGEKPQAASTPDVARTPNRPSAEPRSAPASRQPQARPSESNASPAARTTTPELTPKAAASPTHADVVAVAARPAAPPRRPDWKELLEAGRYAEARRAIVELFQSTDSDPLRLELAEHGMAVNRRLLITNPDSRDVEFREVYAGENPTRIARSVPALHGEPGILMLLNGLTPGTVLRAGAKVRVPKGTWSLLADKSLFTLWLCCEGCPYKAYPICIGADDKTPATQWTVGIKTPKPTWTAPAEWLEKEKLRNPIPYGHPKNPLGEYWIALDAPGFFGFGIHGTNEPNTIGSRASNGCIRLLNADVIELASCVWKGMDVVVVE